MSNKLYTVRVFVNVYDLHPCNGCLWYFGFGLFHCGVQLKYEGRHNRHSIEYSYLGNVLTQSTGVFHCEPKSVECAKYRTSLDIATIQISNRELSLILDKLRSLYLAKDYDILTKNCNHFCDDFVYELTSLHLDPWLNRTASIVSCCHCCIPQTFFDALVEIQANYNENSVRSPEMKSQSSQSQSSQSNKYISWIYSNSYMKDESSKKLMKNGHCIDSDSENHCENDTKMDKSHKIDDYMNHKHSVTVIGLKSSDSETNILPITPLNDHIILTNKTEENKCKNGRKKFKNKNSNGFVVKLRLDKSVMSDSNNECDSDNSANWANDSYQRLPKTPTPSGTSQKSLDPT